MTDKPFRFENPYATYQGEKETHSFEVSKNDAKTIKSIRPAYGTMTGTMGYLLSKLINELKRLSIIDFSREGDFERFVANCHIVTDEEYQRINGGGLPNGAVGGTLSNTTASNVGTAAKGPCDAVAPVEAKPSDVQSRGRSTRKGKGNK